MSNPGVTHEYIYVYVDAILAWKAGQLAAMTQNMATWHMTYNWQTNGIDHLLGGCGFQHRYLWCPGGCR